MVSGVIDFHCHLLPGIDDGPNTEDEAVEMAAAMQKAGFTTVHCTPHLIKGSYEADNRAVRASLDSLQKRLNDENIDLNLLSGREYYLDEYLADYLKDPLPLGETRFIMIEIPNQRPEQFVKEVCFNVRRSGFIPMIAHPERCDLFAKPSSSGAGSRNGSGNGSGSKLSKYFPFSFKSRFSDRRSAEGAQSGALSSREKEHGTQHTTLLSYLIDLGCAFQANLGSFSAWYGPDVQQTANYLEKMAVYTHFGTDLHSRSGLKAIRQLAIRDSAPIN